MVTSVTSSQTNKVSSANAALTQIKTDLTEALKTAGITDAKSTDATPKGFPVGVSWADAYKMVTRRVDDKNPATPGTLVLSPDLLKKTIAGTQSLKDLGYSNLSRFAKGTSVEGALDELFKSKTNGILASTLAKSGIYDLSAFPAGTTAYQAFKLIEDPEKPGKISMPQFTSLKESYSALSGLGIKSLANFPRGTTVVDAKNILEPKAASILAMVGVNNSFFKNANISPLQALAVLSKLPDSIREMNPLPAGMSGSKLAIEASAAKKLVAMGYDSLGSFGAMKAFGTEPVTASAALAQVTKTPVPNDLPMKTSESTERLFADPATAKIINFGAANPIRQSVYSATTDDKVKAKTLPPLVITTAADVLAANIAYWSRK